MENNKKGGKAKGGEGERSTRSWERQNGRITKLEREKREMQSELALLRGMVLGLTSRIEALEESALLQPVDPNSLEQRLLMNPRNLAGWSSLTSRAKKVVENIGFTALWQLANLTTVEKPSRCDLLTNYGDMSSRVPHPGKFPTSGKIRSCGQETIASLRRFLKGNGLDFNWSDWPPGNYPWNVEPAPGTTEGDLLEGERAKIAEGGFDLGARG